MYQRRHPATSLGSNDKNALFFNQLSVIVTAGTHFRELLKVGVNFENSLIILWDF